MDGNKTSVAVTLDEQKLMEIAEPAAEALLCVTKHFSTPIMAGSKLHESLMAIRNIPLESAGKDHVDAAEHTFEDSMRSEATFRFTVTVQYFKSFSKMLSPPCFVRGLSWRILVQPSSETQGEYLGFFLVCDGVGGFLDWSCRVKGDLRLVPLIPHSLNRQPVCRKFEHKFSSKETDWGYRGFIPWTAMMDPARGYVKDGAVTMEVYMKAEPPQGIP